VTQDQYKRVESLFDELAQLSPELRGEELVRKCPDDHLVSQEVARLLSGVDRTSTTVSPSIFERLHKAAALAEDAGFSPVTPSSIGHYRILEKIGDGGFGTVLKAEQRNPVKRIVALKIIKLGFDTREVIARFEAERQALARMDHPNIAKVFDAGTTENGRPYFVMEYVAGSPITQFADQHRLSVKDRLALFLEICDAITHAHQKAVIHRDVKASNVLGFIRDGQPHIKVIDFGIAKALTSDRLTEMTFNTAQGTAIGSYDSMSPEQAAGSPDIDTRTDVYSLGVLLYQLLTGLLPLDRDRFARMTEPQLRQVICDVEAPRPSSRIFSAGAAAARVAELRGTDRESLARLLRRELEWIPLKALRKERERRYSSPAALADDIRNYLAGRPLVAGPETRRYRFVKFIRRHAALVTAAAIILLVLLLGILATSIEAIRATNAQRAARTSESRALGLLDEKNRLAAEKTTLAAQALVDAKNARLRLGEAFLEKARRLRDDQDNFTAAMTAGYAINFATEPDPLASVNSEQTDQRELLDRNTPDWRDAWDISALYPSPRLVWRTAPIIQHGGPVRSVVFSPDGKTLASASDDRTARIWNLQNGALLLSISQQVAPVLGVAFSHDSNTLALACANSAALWDMKTGRRMTMLVGHQAPIRCLQFDPTGTILATGSEDHTVRVWNPQTAATRFTLTGHSGAVVDLSFSPDHRKLASASDDATIRVWNPATGQPLLTIRQSTGEAASPFRSVTFASDGKTLASSAKDGTISLWDNFDGHLIRNLTAERVEIASLRFSHNGKFLAGGATDHSARVWDVASASLVQTLHGPSQAILAVDFSPDDSHLAAGSADSRVTTWDLVASQSQSRPQGLTDLPTAVAFHPDGKVIATGCTDNSISLWNARTGSILQTLSATSRPFTGDRDSLALAFSPDGSKFASAASANSQITLWDASTSKPIWRSHGADPNLQQSAIAFSPDGRTLASTFDHNTIRIWDVASGAPLQDLSGHTGEITTLGFSPDGKTLASGSADDTICLWNLQISKPFLTLKGHTRRVTAVAFSADCKYLASGAIDGTIRVWNPATGQVLRTLQESMLYVFGLSFSPDGRTLACASADNAIHLWDVLTGQQLRTLRGFTEAVTSIAFSSDGNSLASTSADATLSLWQVTSQSPSLTFVGHTDFIASISYSSDGRFLASGSRDKTARIWSAATGSLLKVLQGHTDPVYGVAFSQDGNLLATASEDGTVRLWDTSSGRPLHVLAGFEGGCLCVAVSPDGSLTAAGSRGRNIMLWDASGHLLHTLQGHTEGVYAVAFSPDGKMLASGSRDYTVKLWDTSSGDQLRTLNGHSDRVSSVAFSPAGNTLASGSYDGAICLWEVQSGRLIRRFGDTPRPDADYGVTAVRFSPDGKMLVSSARRDGLVRLWDVDTGRQLDTIHALQSRGGVFGVSFSSDGSSLAAGSDDNIIRTWPVQPRIPLRQFLKIYRFDGLDLISLPTVNLYSGEPFHVQTLPVPSDN
jgi:WD40 repeat protein/serine/threonine protein kinase